MRRVRKLESLGKNRSYRAPKVSALILLLGILLCIAPVNSRAQAAAEAAGAVSSAAGMATAVSKLPGAIMPAQVVQSPSSFLALRDGPAVEQANRKSLQQRAGKDAAKLLLRSTPPEAVIFVDGMSVGLTPLLLILPPGQYQVEMRGPRQEFGGGLIDLAPNETREYAPTLTPRYAASITAHPAAPSPSTAPSGGVTNATGTTKAQSVIEINFAAKSSASGASRPSRPVVPSGPSPEEIANRGSLEQGAGTDAAKLLLQSAPPEALVYIDGMPVGSAPLQLTVAPGRYTVKMVGKGGESGERLVGLLPKDTQQVTLPLVSQYPAAVSVQWPTGASESR